jgi:hypothetical protein
VWEQNAAARLLARERNIVVNVCFVVVVVVPTIRREI